jgi:hypothetical protein
MSRFRCLTSSCVIITQLRLSRKGLGYFLLNKTKTNVKWGFDLYNRNYDSLSGRNN